MSLLAESDSTAGGLVQHICDQMNICDQTAVCKHSVHGSLLAPNMAKHKLQQAGHTLGACSPCPCGGRLWTSVGHAGDRGSILPVNALLLHDVLTWHVATKAHSTPNHQPCNCSPSCRPKLLYTIPIHNNPAGTTLPLHKRQQLLQLAHKYRFTVVADEVYQLLSFPDSPPPPPPMRAVERQMLQDGVLPLSKHNEGHALGSNTGSDKQVAGAHHNTGSAATAAAGCQIASEPASQGDGDAKSSIISDYLNIQLPQEDPISAASMVVSLGSFSKIMAPGLRLG